MAIRDLLRSVLVSVSLAPAARVNGTVNGTGVDLRGYDGAVVVVQFGNWTDGTHTPSVQHSVDGVTYTAATAADLDGTLTAVNSVGTANSVQQVGYIGSLRFVRVVMVTTGATTGALSAATVIAGHPRTMPTQ